MMQLERDALDKWAEQEKVDIHSWAAGSRWEVRKWKDGKPHRRTGSDKHLLLEELRAELAKPAPGAEAVQAAVVCAACPEPSVHTFHILVSGETANLAGMKPTGKHVPGGPYFLGSTDEELPMCVKCMAQAFQSLAFSKWDPRDWAWFVKNTRAKKP